jgi:hypothetical protein
LASEGDMVDVELLQTSNGANLGLEALSFQLTIAVNSSGQLIRNVCSVQSLLVVLGFCVAGH